MQLFSFWELHYTCTCISSRISTMQTTPVLFYKRWGNCWWKWILGLSYQSLAWSSKTWNGSRQIKYCNIMYYNDLSYFHHFVVVYKTRSGAMLFKLNGILTNCVGEQTGEALKGVHNWSRGNSNFLRLGWFSKCNWRGCIKGI